MDERVPRITTIIPTYRRPALLRRAIVSVLEQDYPDFQVCVYDNASGDETEAVVTELANADPRVRYYRHDTNVGGMANFQFGISRVDTPFFSFLSDDDYVLPGFFREAMAALDATPQAMYWAGLTLRVEPDGKFFDARVDGWDREGLFVPPDGAMRLLRGQAPCWVGTLFRQEAIQRIGVLDDEVGGAIDLDYMLRLAARFPYLVSKFPAAVYTMSADAASLVAPLSAFWPGWLKMIRNVEEVSTLDAAARQQIVDALHVDGRRMLFRRGARYLVRGGYDNARACADALDSTYHASGRSGFLRLASASCRHLPLVQRLYTWSYRAVEREMVRRRDALAAKYAGLPRNS